MSQTITLLLALLITGIPTTANGEPTIPLAAKVQLLADAAYYPVLLDKIRTAGKSIDLVMYLWKTSATPGSKSGELILALGEARRRGIGIRVLLEYSGYDEELNRANRETAERLAQEGIIVFFDAAGVTTHAKLAVIDQRFCLIGSHNLTQSALGRNREISIILDDLQLAGELGRYINNLLGNAKPPPVQARPPQSAPR